VTPPWTTDGPAGDAGVTLVTTVGRGSMDRYGQKLAAHLAVGRLELTVDHASAGLFNAPLLGAASLRAFAVDAAVVRELRRQRPLLHLAHHHLARYGLFLSQPYLLTVHDLIRYFDLKRLGVFINRPNLRDQLCLRLDYAAMTRAPAIIAVSHTTKRDLVRHLGVPGGRISVVYEGLDHDLFRPVPDRIVEPPYVLFVGSEHPRKNVAGLLRAFAGLKRDPRFGSLRLVKVGAAGSGEAPFRRPTLALVRELGLERDVLFTEEVPDEDLPAYYSGAACLVLPSFYEGFGFPPVEAMACGCPVVVSTAGALPEIVGPAALRVPPHDVDGLAAAMRTLLTDAAVRDRLRTAGLERARAFSWDRAAAETLRVYRTVYQGEWAGGAA
jgi:glycosyltransferase involved in cell wall biosynthesis